MARDFTASNRIPDDFSSAISVDTIEAAKLDARIYSADDFDGQTEGAASSGNFNYALLQSELTDDHLPEDISGKREEAAFISNPEIDDLRSSQQPVFVQMVPTQASNRVSESEPSSDPYIDAKQVALSTSIIQNQTTNGGDSSSVVTHSFESNSSSDSSRTVIVDEGGGGSTTVTINETTNNQNTTTFNITNIDNSSTGDTIINNGGGGGGPGIDINIINGSITNNVSTKVSDGNPIRVKSSSSPSSSPS